MPTCHGTHNKSLASKKRAAAAAAAAAAAVPPYQKRRKQQQKYHVPALALHLKVWLTVDRLRIDLDAHHRGWRRRAVVDALIKRRHLDGVLVLVLGLAHGAGSGGGHDDDDRSLRRGARRHRKERKGKQRQIKI